MTGIAPQIEHLRLAEDWNVGILRRDEDTWVLSFTDGSGAPRPIAGQSLLVEAISSDMIARNLKLQPGETDDVVVAEGWVEFATHARVSLTTAGGLLLRQHRFADAPQVLADPGPRGGFLTDMGHGAHVEVVNQGGSVWSLVFYDGGVEGPAAPAELITLETIDAKGTVTIFKAEMTPVASRLSVSTAGVDPVRLRATWSHGDHAHRREFDLVGVSEA